MFIKNISLKNFRNYGELNFSPSRYINVLQGRNAQGKTNLLEALYILSSSKSFRVRSERELLKWDNNFAEIKAQIECGDGRLKDIAMRWLEENGSLERRIFVNGSAVRKLGLFLGEVLLTLFVPGDLSLTQGAPSLRRRYLDVLLCKISPIYYDCLSRYKNVLQQKNKLLHLKDLGSEYYKNLSVADKALLEALDVQLLEFGARIICFRALLLEYIETLAADFYGKLSGDSEDLLKLDYKSKALPADEADFFRRLRELSSVYAQGELLIKRDIDEELLRLARESYLLNLKERRSRIILRNTAGIGPHTDDFAVSIKSSRSLKYFGSQGQHRSVVLALRLAEAKVMAEINREKSIILLDDCFSELDGGRVRMLVSYLLSLNCQVFITAAHSAAFADADKEKIRFFEVSSGRISEV